MLHTPRLKRWYTHHSAVPADGSTITWMKTTRHAQTTPMPANFRLTAGEMSLYIKSTPFLTCFG